MSGLKYFDMKIEYDHMVSKISGLNDHIAALEAENAELHTLTVRLSDLLSRTANALKGEPVDCLHSLSDLPEVAGKLKEAVSSVLKCGECNLYHGYICPMCARGLQALKGGE